MLLYVCFSAVLKLHSFDSLGCSAFAHNMYCFYEKENNTGQFIMKGRVPVPLAAFDSDPDLASLPRFTEKGNLEVLLFTVQSKLRANNQKVYTPREGRLISDINKVHGPPTCPTGGPLLAPALLPQLEHPSLVQM